MIQYNKILWNNLAKSYPGEFTFQIRTTWILLLEYICLEPKLSKRESSLFANLCHFMWGLLPEICIQKTLIGLMRRNSEYDIAIPENLSKLSNSNAKGIIFRFLSKSIMYLFMYILMHGSTWMHAGCIHAYILA